MERKAIKMQQDVLEYHQKLEATDRAIADKLYEIIQREFPDVELKVWHAHPVWFINENPIVGYSKLKHCVRLLFWSGQSFDEQELQKEGTFKAAEKRYTDVTEVDATALKRWLKKARAIQWDYKNLIKRKGKLERLL